MYDFGDSEKFLYLGYVDFGDMSFTCTYCGVVFWYEEHSQKSTYTTSPQFSLCCMKGKIVLPLLKKPPSLVCLLSLQQGPRLKGILIMVMVLPILLLVDKIIITLEI